jgi:hypothetical protein
LRGLVTPNDIRYPTSDTVARLEEIAQDADKQRADLLRERATPEDALTLTAPGTPTPKTNVRDAAEIGEALFRRKRAAKLADLLGAKILCERLGVFSDPLNGIPTLLWNDQERKTRNERGRSALRIILNANKETKIGTSMMEIIVCGAIPPYNHLLGGKLVAMLLTSPQVIRDYQDRYGSMPSTIASQMKGQDVTRPADLAYLGTTSLYGVVKDGDRKRPASASQYNRIRIPADIAGGKGEIRYELIGATEGYGVVHFSADTRAALEELDLIQRGAKHVNSIFGEGTSPRMRKIRQGMNILKIDDRFLMHGHGRLVYAIRLAHNTDRYLRGEDITPDYIFPSDDPKAVTDNIARYWTRRWLASRLDHAPALESLAAFQKENVAVSRDLPNAPLPPEPILPL